MIKDFKDWLIEDVGQLSTVKAFLRTPLSDNPTALQKQLASIEAWYGRATTLLADANSYLDNAIAIELLKIKQDDYVSLERKAITDKAVSGERRIRDIVQGYVEAIKQRISLGQSLLRMQYEERFAGKNN